MCLSNQDELGNLIDAVNFLTLFGHVVLEIDKPEINIAYGSHVNGSGRNE